MREFLNKIRVDLALFALTVPPIRRAYERKAAQRRREFLDCKTEVQIAARHRL